MGFCIYEKNGTESKYEKNQQVRAPMGEGIRNITINKTATKSELMDKISVLFFPDGKNGHGDVKVFYPDVSTDVHGSQLVHKNETVQELIERLGLKHLRCYLLAKEVVSDKYNSDSSLQDSLEDLPDMFPHKRTTKRKGIMSPRADSNRVEDAEEVRVSSHGSDNDEVIMVSHEDVATTVEEHHIHQGALQSEQGAVFTADQMKGDSDFIITQNVECASSTQQGLPNAEYNVPVDPDIHSANRVNAISINLPQAYNIPDEFIQEDTLARMNDSDTLQFGPFLLGDPDLNAKQPAVKEIKVHRGNVCRELIDYFSEEDNIRLIGTTFEVKMIKSNGTTELAEDNGGAMRDFLTEFYDSFYLQYTTGNSVAVPVLRHDMTGIHWSAVAEVIRVGFRQEGIFPVRLALPFMQQTLCLSDDPLDAFLQMIPDIDRLMLEDALKTVSSVDEDELFDLMERHEAKQKPTDANIRKVLTEMAHKEIVQTPLFVAVCWRPKLNTLGISQHQLRDIYANLKPDTKKVLKILEFPESMCTEERTLSSSIKRLVREMDISILGLFLRVCTGCNLMVTKKISVRFTESVVCCPTSYTCGSVLEVPRSYAAQPYITLKSECTTGTLLNNRYWQMDII